MRTATRSGSSRQCPEPTASPRPAASADQTPVSLFRHAAGLSYSPPDEWLVVPPVLSRRRDQGQERPVVRILLGMPLHPHPERVVGKFDGLDDAVILRPRGGGEPVAEPVDGLVVMAGDQ